MTLATTRPHHLNAFVYNIFQLHTKYMCRFFNNRFFPTTHSFCFVTHITSGILLKAPFVTPTLLIINGEDNREQDGFVSPRTPIVSFVISIAPWAIILCHKLKIVRDTSSREGNIWRWRLMEVETPRGVIPFAAFRRNANDKRSSRFAVMTGCTLRA